MQLGTHIILDFFGCNAQVLMHVSEIQEIMREACRIAHFTVVAEEYHQFQPNGVSGVTIIQESNCSFHSWPEHKYASIDIYYCGENAFVEDAIKYFIEQLQPKLVERLNIPRGLKETYTLYADKD